MKTSKKQKLEDSVKLAKQSDANGQKERQSERGDRIKEKLTSLSSGDRGADSSPNRSKKRSDSRVQGPDSRVPQPTSSK